MIIFNWLINVLKVKDLKIGLVRPDTEHGKTGSGSANEQAKKYGLELTGDVILYRADVERGDISPR